ncbi:hypothetical protein [Thermococcus zilligii]|nr:hypothetical protein [Thermococcus zilligii]
MKPRRYPAAFILIGAEKRPRPDFDDAVHHATVKAHRISSNDAV